MPLFHFSENPNIERFVPRAPINHPEAESMVWAIDEWHSPLYYFPSDCPRVCFWPLPTTSQEDLRKLWHDESLRMIIAIESKWLPEVNSAKLYRYTFSEEGFVDCEDHGVWVSGEAVTPVKVEPIGSPTEELLAATVELRLCPSLIPLGQLLQTTSLHWSLIRMRFAQGWPSPGGTPTMPKENIRTSS